MIPPSNGRAFPIEDKSRFQKGALETTPPQCRQAMPHDADPLVFSTDRTHLHNFPRSQGAGIFLLLSAGPCDEPLPPRLPGQPWAALHPPARGFGGGKRPFPGGGSGQKALHPRQEPRGPESGKGPHLWKGGFREGWAPSPSKGYAGRSWSTRCNPSRLFSSAASAASTVCWSLCPCNRLLWASAGSW